jgi:DNA replication protein DnaC
MMKNTHTNYQDLCNKLRSMKMSGMADSLEKQINDPNNDLRSFDDRVSEIITAEWDLRYSKKFNRFLKKATLKYPAADIDDSIYDADRFLDTGTIESLAACTWIEDGRNLLITGSTGSGKTYISNALCISALRKFLSVKYIKASTLIYELEQAQFKGEYLNYTQKIAAFDLLVIDDFGLMELDIDKCRNLFEVIDSRDCRNSTMVISQIPVSNWYDMFKDNTYADACMDRIIHNAYRLEFNGRNMRNPSK